MADCIIVVPCYNEAARLDVEAFRRFVAEDHPQRFLFVDDGSTDATLDVLRSLQASAPERFGVHALAHNRGKAEAVRQGILRALADSPAMVGFWDADLATPLDAIPEFCDVLEQNPGLQVVLGSRVRLLGRTIERRPERHAAGRIFATAASLVLGLPVYDTQCGAKLLRVGPEVRALFQRPFQTNWVFDVELLARFLRRRAPGGEPVESVLYELPLKQWRDVAGSKVRPRDFFKAFFELARIYWTYFRPGAAVGLRVLPSPESVASSKEADRPARRRAA